MSNESMARTVVAITDIFDTLPQKHWFISFGSLLWFVRDRLLGRPLEQDIDISVLYGEIARDDLIRSMADYGYKLSVEHLDNYHRKPLQMTFTPQAPGLYPIDIDVFFWVIGHDYAWHSYDMFNRDKPIIGEYSFKATPKEFILAPTIAYSWEEIAPDVKFPSMYGSLLDTWYPPSKGPDGKYIANTGWMVRNKQYGQSKFAKMKTIKDCKKMEELG